MRFGPEDIRFGRFCPAAGTMGGNYYVTADKVSPLMERRTDGQPERVLGVIILARVGAPYCSDAVAFTTESDAPVLTQLPDGAAEAIVEEIAECPCDTRVIGECPTLSPQGIVRILKANQKNNQ